MTWDDTSIVQALLAGDPGSWDYFVERFGGLVSGCVRRVLRGRGLKPAQADVDDLTENVFVMLLEKDGALLQRYDPRYRLSAYLAVLARTAVHRHLRREKPKAQLPDAMWGDAIPDDARLSASDRTTHGEILGAVRDMLGTLSERDQRLLRLFYFDNADYQAIAKTLEVSVNSVGAALSRARARLAKALEAHQDLTGSDWRSV